MSPSKKPVLCGSRSGFTLIELMVVIMIIAILSGIVLTAVGGGDDDRAVNAGINRMRSLFTLAQSAAITRKTTTRLIIHADPTDPNDTTKLNDRFLRFATIVYQEQGADTPLDPSDDVWLPYIDGEYLPGGVYFSPALSSGGSYDLKIWGVQFNPNALTFSNPQNPLSSGSSFLSGQTDSAAGKGTGSWYMYEFRSNGTFVNPIGRFAVANAIGSKDGLFFPSEGGFNLDQVLATAQGFVIFRSGQLLYFQDPEQYK